MRVFRALPDFRMAARQEQGIGIADLGLDDAEIAGSVEQAGVPAFPVGQLGLDFVAKSHERNVTERSWQDNGNALVLQHVQRDERHGQDQCARDDELH